MGVTCVTGSVIIRIATLEALLHSGHITSQAELVTCMLHVLQGLSLPEQQLEKLCYTLDTLHQKLEELGFELQTLEGALRFLFVVWTASKNIQVCSV